MEFWGDVSQVSLVLSKEFILDFLEALLSKKRKAYQGVTSFLKVFLLVCEVMFLGLEFIWQGFSCSTQRLPCVFLPDMFFHDEDVGLADP